MTIGLVSLVRDEQETVAAMIESALPLIDTWTVVDTGSKDGTKEIIHDTLDGIRGVLYERGWVGFAHNRSELLALARNSADYLLQLDGDHLLRVDGPLPELTADEYLCPVRGEGMDWRLPLLIRGDRNWRYEGVAHAHLVTDGPIVVENLDCISVDGGSGASREKLERDVAALTQEHARRPSDPRTCFYLARSHDDLGAFEDAIYYYRLRLQMDGWDQERFYARLRLGVLLAENVNYYQGARELLAAAEMIPARAAEPLRALAYAGHAVADKIPQPTDGLFIHRDAYRERSAA